VTHKTLQDLSGFLVTILWKQCCSLYRRVNSPCDLDNQLTWSLACYPTPEPVSKVIKMEQHAIMRFAYIFC